PPPPPAPEEVGSTNWRFFISADKGPSAKGTYSVFIASNERPFNSQNTADALNFTIDEESATGTLSSLKRATVGSAFFTTARKTQAKNFDLARIDMFLVAPGLTDLMKGSALLSTREGLTPLVVIPSLKDETFGAGFRIGDIRIRGTLHQLTSSLGRFARIR